MKTPDPLPRLRLGIRAVVRHELPDGRHTDSVGTIEALDAATVTVQTRHGVDVIPLAEISIVKEVPPRPVRRGAPHRALSMSDLERVMAAGWPAVEQAPLGDWRLRASAGYTRRANSVLAVGDPGVELGAAVERAESWYAERALPCRIALHGPAGFVAADDPLGALLLSRGYQEGERTAVLTASTDPLPSSDGPTGVTVDALDRPSAAWWSLADVSPAHRAAAEQIVVAAPDQVFLVAEQDGATVAAVRVAFAHVWAGINLLAVRPDHRRRGLGRLLVAAAAGQARSRGIRSVYLQVGTENLPAVALYRAAGFESHHEYSYLVAG